MRTADQEITRFPEVRLCRAIFFKRGGCRSERQFRLQFPITNVIG